MWQQIPLFRAMCRQAAPQKGLADLVALDSKKNDFQSTGVHVFSVESRSHSIHISMAKSLDVGESKAVSPQLYMFWNVN